MDVNLFSLEKQRLQATSLTHRKKNNEKELDAFGKIPHLKFQRLISFRK
jgi:hypothetical protein